MDVVAQQKEDTLLPPLPPSEVEEQHDLGEEARDFLRTPEEAHGSDVLGKSTEAPLPAEKEEEQYTTVQLSVSPSPSQETSNKSSKRDVAMKKLNALRMATSKALPSRGNQKSKHLSTQALPANLESSASVTLSAPTLPPAVEETRSSRPSSPIKEEADRLKESLQLKSKAVLGWAKKQWKDAQAHVSSKLKGEEEEEKEMTSSTSVTLPDVPSAALSASVPLTETTVTLSAHLTKLSSSAPLTEKALSSSAPVVDVVLMPQESAQPEAKEDEQDTVASTASTAPDIAQDTVSANDSASLLVQKSVSEATTSVSSRPTTPTTLPAINKARKPSLIAIMNLQHQQQAQQQSLNVLHEAEPASADRESTLLKTESGSTSLHDSIQAVRTRSTGSNTPTTRPQSALASGMQMGNPGWANAMNEMISKGKVGRKASEVSITSDSSFSTAILPTVAASTAPMTQQRKGSVIENGADNKLVHLTAGRPRPANRRRSTRSGSVVSSLSNDGGHAEGASTFASAHGSASSLTGQAETLQQTTIAEE